MDRTRRSFLKGLAIAGTSAAAAAVPVVSEASQARHAPEDAVGMLYDTTRCIGCKACVVACHEANDLPPDNRTDALHDQPQALNDRTKNIIKLYKEEGRRSYMKQQCMHCIDPACAGACMIGALQKREHGIVTWDPNRCIGCRYCQVACPYSIPKFEWESTNPRIVKCELCNHRIKDGGIPACCEVCPREAVVYGKYTELLAEAKRRQAEHPGRYVDKIYGEHDGGGTQVLYLSHVPFEKLGLPTLGEKSVPSLNRTIQHGIYKGMIAPAALYAVMGGVMLRNRKKNRDEEGGDA
ncbi:hydrogenase 2 operon protein HybA [bacterium]|nr:hydrogenase 2 operon protein HybA [bacterium]